MARRLSPWRRRAAAGLLLFAVLAAHLGAGDWLALQRLDWGDAGPPPPRLKAAFVRELRPAPVMAPLPVPVAAAPRPVRPRASLRAAAPAASAPAVPAPASAAAPASAPGDAIVQAASAPAVAAAPAIAESPAPFAEAAAPSAEAAPGPPAESSSTAAVTAIEWPSQWPASTRLRYALTGWFRGELHGDATVEWLRDGTRYQVHLDVTIGPSLAPLASRSLSSDGELSADGLEPQRYDERSRFGFAPPRHWTIRFLPDAVLLPGGRLRERPPGVQDAASQFVHLTWLFTTRPGLLAPGQGIELPLALPRSVEPWAYDVREAEPLQLPFATLPVLHLKPRRVPRAGGDLVMEAWFAPTLLYLPVRIRIHQDAETWIDLKLDAPPLQ